MTRTHASTSFTVEVTLCIITCLIIITVAFGAWPVSGTYELQATSIYDDKIHVIDTDLTLYSCLEDANYQRSRWGTNVSFSCIDTNPPEDTPFTRFEK